MVENIINTNQYMFVKTNLVKFNVIFLMGLQVGLVKVARLGW